MTTAQRDAIANPAEGLTIYNTTNRCFEGYSQGGWHLWGCYQQGEKKKATTTMTDKNGLRIKK